MQAQPPSPVAPSSPAADAATGAAADAAAATIAPGIASDPAAVLQGLRAQRSELRDQLSSLEDMRRDLGRELNQQPQSEVQLAGVEKRLAEVDARIAATDKQIAAADAQVAAATAVPGATVEPPPVVVRHSGPDEEIVAMSLVFLFVLFLPIVIAYSRRIWRRSAKVVTTLPGEVLEHFSRLEQSVEAVAVEVERIGEGQRFMTRVLSDAGVTAELAAGRREPR
ncbi:MAG: hypothetical protein ACYC2G_12015 [Gemmatimonadaceae bacterium]